MPTLAQQHILLGISGGIAAYKAAELTRLFIKAGAHVRVCMTAGATHFVTPLTFQALSGNPVHTTLLDPEAEAGMGHIELARWADQIVIAPASANCIARLAHGFADDLLSTLCLASPAPLHIAPAMNQQMWANAATQANIATLKSRNIKVLGPASGEQACGDMGFGRMLEPEQIVQLLQADTSTLPLSGVNVILTAGPTREAIDPVRFISNRSSGKMGFALAEAAQALGANVTLISGPVALSTPIGVKCIKVESAEQMLNATLEHMSNQHIFIATAAVADYTPQEVVDKKIKKSAAELSLPLKRTQDILATVTERYPQLFSVGFAAETHDLMTYARGKLERKNLQMVAANSVAGGKVFDQDTNALEVVWRGGQHSFPEMAKPELAQQLMQLIAQRFQHYKDMP
jgi:phosphopantothenoylcysteine decarboxylase/phosphopantothenate--cysteine ligase